MAGARRSRRKPGQDEHVQDRQAFDEGYAGSDKGDPATETDEWMTPFRSVQSVKPVLPQRNRPGAHPGPAEARGHSEPRVPAEPARAQAEPRVQGDVRGQADARPGAEAPPPLPRREPRSSADPR